MLVIEGKNQKNSTLYKFFNEINAKEGYMILLERESESVSQLIPDGLESDTFIFPEDLTIEDVVEVLRVLNEELSGVFFIHFDINEEDIQKFQELEKKAKNMFVLTVKNELDELSFREC